MLEFDTLTWMFYFFFSLSSFCHHHLFRRLIFYFFLSSTSENPFRQKFISNEPRNIATSRLEVGCLCARVCLRVLFIHTIHPIIVVSQILEYVMFVSRSVYAPGHTFNNILNIRFVQIDFRFAYLSPSLSLAFIWLLSDAKASDRVRSVRIRTSYVHGRNQKSFFSACKMKSTSNFGT